MNTCFNNALNKLCPITLEQKIRCFTILARSIQYVTRIFTYSFGNDIINRRNMPGAKLITTR